MKIKKLTHMYIVVEFFARSRRARDAARSAAPRVPALCPCSVAQMLRKYTTNFHIARFFISSLRPHSRLCLTLNMFNHKYR